MAAPVALAFRISANLAEFRTSLAEGRAQLETTKTAMRNMANGLDGSSLIANGNAMVKVVSDLGGAAKLTDAEQRRVNATLNEAIEKYHALGKVAPAGMHELRRATSDVKAPTEDLATSFSKFDNILSSMGIHISQEVKGLGELAGASGKTATELGTMTTAGLAAAAGMGGWKIGRMVSEFFDLDKAIGDVTAKLFGFGDVAAAEAGAKADVLAKASKLAGVNITDLSLAMVINEGAAKSHAESLNTSANRVAGWRIELDKVKASGIFELLTTDLASQNFEVKELSERYHISAEAIQFYARETKKADDDVVASNKRKLDAIADAFKRQDELFKQEEKARDATGKLRAQLLTIQVEQGGTAHDIELARINEWEAQQIGALKRAGTATVENMDLIATSAAKMRDGVGIDFGRLRQISLDTAIQQRDDALATYQYMQAHSDQYTRGAMEEQKQKYRDLAEAATASGRAAADGQNMAKKATEQHTATLTEQFLAQSKLLALEAAKMNAAPVSQDVTSQNFERIIRAYQTNSGWNPGGAGSGIDPNQAFAWARLGYSLQEILTMFDRQKRGMTGPLPPPQGPRIPGFEVGVQNAPGGWSIIGERGPEMMYVPPRADIYPHGSGPAAGVTLIVHNYISHPLGTPEEIGRVVGDAVLTRWRNSGGRLPMGI